MDGLTGAGAGGRQARVGSRWVKPHDEGDGQAREMRGRQGGWGEAGNCAVRVRVREGGGWEESRCVSGAGMWRWRAGMRGGRKVEMRQPRDALLGGSKEKGLACKEGSGRGLRLGGRQLLQGEHTRSWQDRCGR